MKKSNLFFVLLLALLALQVSAQDEAKPFEHLSISANAGTMGVGVQVATPMTRFLTLRAGVMMFKYSYDYEYDGIIRHGDYEGTAPIPMTAKADMVNGLLVADIFPFRNVPIHLTGGFYVGKTDIIKVSTGDLAGRPIEIGDLIINPENGRVSADLETKGFKPYVGLGFGRSITKNNLVGFKCELGAMFHGSPTFIIKEGKDITDQVGIDASEDLDSFNKFLKNFNVYPVLNLQLHFRAF
ncbi:hypothetical protein LJC54_09405 [Parabacteroides sp. OttesenSCG-928-J18]|nr:hypothetical protein [Parabacteroides sp. OttesenSCG-928-J18]